MKILQLVKINCASVMDLTAESFELPSCIRDYHIRKDLWNPLLRNLPHCQRERSDNRDRVCNRPCARWSHC